MRKRSGRPPRFAAVPNETVDDADNLDLEALGLLTVVLRHRDGYEITLPEIAEKYGYGRDGLAGAWGLLQVARYIIKVKLQWSKDNQWATEVVVYDTPATDDEIAELLASIASEPNVRTVKLEPPTKTARERAAKHLARVAAKQKARPERRRLDFDVPGESARGRGRREGVEGRGSQATTPAAAPKPSTRSAAPRGGKQREPGRRLTPQEAAAVRLVEAAFPEQLGLPSYRPPVLRDAILAALDSRTPEVLVERIKRRWWMHGYEEAVMPGGRGIGSAVGVAVALVRPSTECPDLMCEDGVVLDTQAKCRTCEQRKEDRKVSVPAQRGGPGEKHGSPVTPQRWECRSCRAPGRNGTEAPEDGLCGPCRRETQEAAAAAAALLDRFAQTEAREERLARERFGELLEEAYAEDAAREQAAAEDLLRREAAARRTAEEAQERRLLEQQIREDHPELSGYSQTA
ncbi:hypothetical protein [Streptomyces sp. NPDC001089]